MSVRSAELGQHVERGVVAPDLARAKERKAIAQEGPGRAWRWRAIYWVPAPVYLSRTSARPNIRGPPSPIRPVLTVARWSRGVVPAEALRHLHREMRLGIGDGMAHFAAVSRVRERVLTAPLEPGDI